MIFAEMLKDIKKCIDLVKSHVTSLKLVSSQRKLLVFKTRQYSFKNRLEKVKYIKKCESYRAAG